MQANEQLSYSITFTQYNRIVLPVDGFAFWVKADIIAPGLLWNGPTPYNGLLPGNMPGAYNTGQSFISPAATQTVQGSLHYTTTNNQDETEGFSINRIIFTSEVEIELLNTVNPKSMFIGVVDGIQFAFSKRNMLFRQSGLFHYQGDALYPSMATQLIEFPQQLSPLQVVSNSLPLWLTLNQFCPMYPSYLVPEDIIPPWCAVHIGEDDTKALQAWPYLDPDTGSHYQLVKDRVRLTFYGLRNAEILSFQDYVNSYSLNSNAFGIMNMPVARDNKRTQAELNILAQKKTMEFEINYYQTSIRNIAQQYIKSALIENVYVEAA